MVEHDLAKVGVAGPSPVSRSAEEEGVPRDILFFDVAFLIKFASLCPDGRADRKEMLRWSILGRSREAGWPIPPSLAGEKGY